MSVNCSFPHRAELIFRAFLKEWSKKRDGTLSLAKEFQVAVSLTAFLLLLLS